MSLPQTKYEIIFSNKNGDNKRYLCYRVNSNKHMLFNYAELRISGWSSYSYSEAFALVRELTQSVEPGKDTLNVRSLAKARLAQKHLTDYYEEAIVSICDRFSQAVVGSMVFTPNPIRT